MLVSQGFPSWKPHLPARNFSYIMTTWGLISGLFCCHIHEVIHHLIWRFPKPPCTSNHPSISKSFQVMNDTRRLSLNVRARACPRSCPRCPKAWISLRERGQKLPAERWELPVDWCWLIWVNYNDLTATSLESWLIREIIPKWPQFSLVKYYNLPR